MPTLTIPRPPAPIVELETGESSEVDSPRVPFRLSNVSWREYVAFLRLFESHPGHRLTYDRGELEIMSPSQAHDDDSQFLGYLVVQMVRAFRLALRLGGSTTLKRKLDERGIEPDNCFWIANARRITRKRKYSLRRDPPPDLAIEVDVTNSSLDRMSIYAAFRIPELWRLDADTLTFYRLGSHGEYEVTETSLSFPSIGPADLMRFVEMSRDADDQTVVLDEFERWLTARIAGQA